MGVTELMGNETIVAINPELVSVIRKIIKKPTYSEDFIFNYEQK